MSKYTNILGKEIVIDEIPDKDLVATYRFFLSYCKIISRILSTVPAAAADAAYIKHSQELMETKEALKSEIKSRKIIMKNI